MVHQHQRIFSSFLDLCDAQVLPNFDRNAAVGVAEPHNACAVAAFARFDNALVGDDDDDDDIALGAAFRVEEQGDVVRSMLAPESMKKSQSDFQYFIVKT